MSDQPKVCLDLMVILASQDIVHWLAIIIFEPWFICLSLLFDLFYFSSESTGKTLFTSPLYNSNLPPDCDSVMVVTPLSPLPSPPPLLLTPD